MSVEEVVAVEQESSGGIDPLVWALIAAGVVLVIAAVVVAVVLSRRRSAPRGTVSYGMPYGAPIPPGNPPPQPAGPGAMAPGWYPDPQRQARLRWFDGNRWTAGTQN